MSNKFTKEEIALCKKIAEKYRRVIKYGDWLLNEGGFAKVWPYRSDCERTDVIPLWQISDCLEFIRKHGYKTRLIEYERDNGTKEIECNCYGHRVRRAFSKWGNKDETACLEAVFAIVEE